jgi:hypothetical protein
MTAAIWMPQLKREPVRQAGAASLSEPIIYTFDWHAKDHASCIQTITRETYRRGFARLMKWCVYAVLAVASVLFIVSTVAGDFETAGAFVPWILLLIFWIVFIGTFIGRIQAWSARRQDPNIAHPFTYTFSDEGFHVSMKSTDVDQRWSGLDKVRETDNLFMFYYTPRCAYYLPKRVLEGDAQVDSFRDWLRQRIPADVDQELSNKR